MAVRKANLVQERKPQRKRGDSFISFTAPAPVCSVTSFLVQVPPGADDENICMHVVIGNDPGERGQGVGKQD